MEFTAAQIAAIIGGKLEGSESVSVSSFGKIEEAEKNQLTFLANPKYEDFLYVTQAAIIIINESLKLRSPIHATLIRVPDAYSAFATLLDKYQQIQQQQLTGIQQPIYQDVSAKIGEGVFIGAFSYIGQNVVLGNNTKVYPQVFLGNNVVIGENCIIHPGVKIYHDCFIGNAVVIHAGTVIGGDGFGFAPQSDGTYKKVPQIGNVVIENGVEIGTNATIDRATIGSTLIKAGAKIDNLVQIAHNVEVGSNTVIAAQAGVSGSTKLGKNVMIGGQAGIVGHIQIADGSKINAQSGVSKSIKKMNSAVTGSPAADFTTSLRNQVALKNIPILEKRMAILEKLLSELTANQQSD